MQSARAAAASLHRRMQSPIHTGTSCQPSPSLASSSALSTTTASQLRGICTSETPRIPAAWIAARPMARKQRQGPCECLAGCRSQLLSAPPDFGASSPPGPLASPHSGGIPNLAAASAAGGAAGSSGTWHARIHRRTPSNAIPAAYWQYRARRSPTDAQRIAHRWVDCQSVLRQRLHSVFQAVQGQQPARRPRTDGQSIAHRPLQWPLPAARQWCLAWRPRTDGQRIAYRRVAFRAVPGRHPSRSFQVAQQQYLEQRIAYR